jgi:hypothetical protein
MFEHIGADDRLIGGRWKMGFLDGAGVDVAVKGFCVLGPMGLGFDGIDREAGVLQQLAEEALGRADIKDGAGAQVLEKPADLLVAAPWVAMEPVVEIWIASGGRGRS